MAAAQKEINHLEEGSKLYLLVSKILEERVSQAQHQLKLATQLVCLYLWTNSNILELKKKTSHLFKLDLQKSLRKDQLILTEFQNIKNELVE